MIRWFANNDIAANFLMATILLAGVYSALFKIPLEVEPARKYPTIYIEMPYRGATAKDVERAILIPVEKALESINGVKMVNADGMRGLAKFWINAEDGYDLRALREEIKGRFDGISTFPQETERPRIIIPDSSNWDEVLSVAVTGDMDAFELRRVAKRVQEDLLEIDGISRVDLRGARQIEISIETDPVRLQSYNLGPSDLVNAIRRSSVDLPAGAINSKSGTVVVRTRGQAYTRKQYEDIPIRSVNGAEVRLGDVATVNDGFVEGDIRVDFNGAPALFLEVMRVGQESAIDISEKVREYIRSAVSRYPQGIRLFVWDDESISIRGRLSTLTTSLVQGCLLVMLILGLFIRPMVAFWVVLGIPVAFAGGVICMPLLGVTANIMSIFGFILVLGLVVDDAIVTSENIYTKLKAGTNPLEASVQGTLEVTVPVTFGVLTTIVAFIPLLFFDGRWGGFAKQIPPVVAPVLLFSLIESKLILPSHLKHLRTGRKRIGLLGRIQKRFADGLEWMVAHIYQPSLVFAVRHRLAVICVFVSMALIMAGYCQGGRMGFVSFPTVDRLKIHASLDLPDHVTLEITRGYIDRIESAVDQLENEFIDPGTGKSLIVNRMKVTGARRTGSNFDKSCGLISIEVMPPSERTAPGPKNSAIVKRWHEIVGKIPGAASFVIRGEVSERRHGGKEEAPLELELRGPSSEKKNDIAQRIKELLWSYEGISQEPWALINRGQDELEFTLEPRAAELGLTQQSLAFQVRQAFYGEEAQRILRDNDDIRVMVRLPRKARESLHTLDHLKIRAPSGAEVPLSTIARIAFVKAPTYVERNDGAEVLRIGARPDDEAVDILGIAREVTPQIREMLSGEENLSFQFTGYVREHEESMRRTIVGSIALLFALFALLAIPFKSIVQPFFVLLAVPFGIIGALLGHMVMGITPSYLSIFGMLALAGVVVNDSFVLVDYINRQHRAGKPLRVAVLEAGSKRFRPILLTSLTTFAGLVPLLLDRSIQAQFLIPMAVSLGAGILFSTVITLYLIPCSLMLADDLGMRFDRVRRWYVRPFLRSEDEDSRQATGSVS